MPLLISFSAEVAAEKTRAGFSLHTFPAAFPASLAGCAAGRRSPFLHFPPLLPPVTSDSFVFRWIACMDAVATLPVEESAAAAFEQPAYSLPNVGILDAAALVANRRENARRPCVLRWQ